MPDNQENPKTPDVSIWLVVRNPAHTDYDSLRNLALDMQLELEMLLNERGTENVNVTHGIELSDDLRIYTRRA